MSSASARPPIADQQSPPEARSGKYTYYVCQSLIKRGKESCDTPRLSTRQFGIITSITMTSGRDSSAVLTATDEDNQASDLTWSISSGADGSKFSITSAGGISFASSKDFESPDDADGGRSGCMRKLLIILNCMVKIGCTQPSTPLTSP